MAFERQKRSGVWRFFDRGAEKSTCTLCGKLYARLSGTSNLLAHLKADHKSEYASIASSTAGSSSSQSRTAAGTKAVNEFFPNKASSSSRPCSSARAGEITELILDWVVDSTRPLSIINDHGFVRLLNFLEPAYRVPSRTHLTRLLNQRHQKAKLELTELLSTEATAGVALTTDCWTSSATQSYSTHTVHFLRSDWSLVSAVLQTTLFHGSHTAVHLAAEAHKVSRNFDLKEEMVVAVTHDEAANMVAASGKMEEDYGWSGEVCVAHRLQTVIKHAIDTTRGVTKLLASCRRLVGHFKHSALSTEILCKKQVELDSSSPPLRVIQDVSTRWNSTFYMLQRLLQLQRAISIILVDPVITPKKDHRDLLLSEHQWTLADQLVKILEEFEVATTVLSGQKYVTLSLALPVVTHLKTVADEMSQSANAGAPRQFATALAQELDGKFSLSDIDTDSAAVMAAALDPRFRGLQFLSEEQRVAVHQRVVQQAEENRQASQNSKLQPACAASGSHSGNTGKEKTSDWLTAPPPPKRIKKEASGISRLLRGASEIGGDDGVSDESRYRFKLEKEVTLYFTEDEIDVEDDPLQWWRVHSSRFPSIAGLSRRYLAIPGTSVPSEVIFSAAGLLVSKLRSSLSPSNIDAAIFLGKNTMLPSSRFGLTTEPCADSKCQPDDAELDCCDPRVVLPEELAADPELPQL